MAQGEKKSMREKNKEGREKDKRHVRVFMCLKRLRVKRINAKINVYSVMQIYAPHFSKHPWPHIDLNYTFHSQEMNKYLLQILVM